MLRWLVNSVLVLLTLLYPFAIYFGLEYKQLEARYLAVLLLAVFALRHLLTRSRQQQEQQPHNRLMLILLSIFALLIFMLNSESGLRFYPVLINLCMLFTFAYTLIYPPSMIERFSRLVTPELSPQGVAYTRKVTMVWCVFFTMNALFSAYTALFFSLKAWSLYNGLIAYGLVGLMFVVEYPVRLYVKRRHQD